MSIIFQRLIKSAGLILIFFAANASAWTNGQNATYVIGQPDFVTGSSGTSATTLNNPRDAALDIINQKLYIVDKDNNRVLRFAYPITSNQPAAELVFGQPDFVSGSIPASAGQNTFNNPFAITVDATGRLWVSSEDHRVVWFNNAHLISANQPDADGVLGQPDFTSSTSGVTQNNTFRPMGIDVDANGVLYVSDTFNHRVLWFNNAAEKANGADADGVLGQPDFVTNTATITKSSMNRPVGLRVFGSTLFVGDRSNGRVLRFDNAAFKANGADADAVLGQADFTTNVGTITQSTLEYPGKMAIDGSGKLYVSDGYNADRVIIFDNALSKADGADADNVIGQFDFTSSGNDITQNRLNMDSHGGGLALDSSSNTLLVSDDNNNRIMVFKSTITGPEFNLKAGANYLPSGSSVDFGKEQSDIIFTIENPGSLDLVLDGSPKAHITGANADQFLVVTQPTSPITTLSNSTFKVRYQPTVLGAATATITITNDDSDESSFMLTLSGNAITTVDIATNTDTDTNTNTNTNTNNSISGGSIDFRFSLLIAVGLMLRVLGRRYVKQNQG